MNSELSVVGYMLAGLAFVVLTLMLVTRSASRIHSVWLIVATSVSALWGFVLAYSGPTVVNPTFKIFVVEILHDGFWLLFLSMLLGGAISQNRFLVVRFGGLACTILILLIGSWAYSGESIGPFLAEDQTGDIALPGRKRELLSRPLTLDVMTEFLDELHRTVTVFVKTGPSTG